MRKLLFAIALLLAVFFVIGRMAEVHVILDTLRQADVKFILLAVGVQILWYFNAGAHLKVIYEILEMEETVPRLALMSAAAAFISTVAPSGGMSGLSVYVAEARQRKSSVGRATIAGVLFMFFEYLGFLVVLALGLIVFIRRDSITAAEISASVLMALLAGGMGALLYLGTYSGPLLGKVLGGMAHLINSLLWPILHRPYFSEEKARHFAIDAAEGLKALRRAPHRAFLPALFGITSKALQLLIMWLSFLAFHVPCSPGTVVGGYTIAYLFLVISPTPGGIGIVEGVLAVTLNSLNVPLGKAAVVALTYRAITIWLPLLLGPLALRILPHLPPPKPFDSPSPQG